MRAFLRTSRICEDTACRCWSRAGACCATNATISSYTFGYSTWKERSSSSHFMVFRPRRCASRSEERRVGKEGRDVGAAKPWKARKEGTVETIGAQAAERVC